MYYEIKKNLKSLAVCTRCRCLYSFCFNVDKKPDMKVYYFEHNLVDSYLFSSGVEIFFDLPYCDRKNAVINN